ncbi:TetR family transcriptional regulator [Streptomyces noursei ZPM]|nr:TetR/AcrR family transcriptional regulator [Streptomyces noursei]AKA08186.1 TetR family transcriptional regulator [Streptomyces noursei ZPM]UWS76828.1 TetR/AcrR family transcriptional regulator [Streptomyces noursei]
MARNNGVSCDRTSERLISSMKQLLWERGYSATSPAAVQRLAKAGQGSMYHHFHSKARLALAAEQRMGEELKREVAERFTAASTTYEKIEAYLAPDEHVIRGCRLGRLIQDEEVASNDELREPIVETYDWIQAEIVRVLTEGVACGELSPDVDVDSLAVSILAIRQGAHVLARLRGSQEPFRQAGRGIAQLLALASPREDSAQAAPASLAD